MAYVWRHAFPVAGGLSDYAGGADVGFAEAEELLCAESVYGCAAVVLEHTEEDLHRLHLRLAIARRADGRRDWQALSRERLEDREQQ